MSKNLKYQDWLKSMNAVIDRKIFWVDTAQRFTLAARIKITTSDEDDIFITGLSESDIDPIQKWCEEHNCGRRTSFDMFEFKNKKQMTMFLLRWG